VAVGEPLIVAFGDIQEVVTPAGKPEIVTPVAPVVEYVILAIAEFTHTVCVAVVPAEVSVMELPAVTVILPVAVAVPQPPIGVMVYVDTPVAVGEPLMVAVGELQEVAIPAGMPEIVTPVTPTPVIL